MAPSRSTPPGDIEARNVPLRSRNDLDQLGIADPEDAFLPRIDLDWERFHVVVIGYDVDWDGNGVVAADLELGTGEIITVGTPVSSEVDYSITTANFFYDFFPRLPFELGLGFGAGFLDYDASIEEIGEARRPTRRPTSAGPSWDSS